MDDSRPKENQQASTDLEADFSPIPTSEASVVETENDDPYQRDSMLAQQAFDQAVAVARTESEQRIIQEYLRASKLAETAREWYLAAVSFHRVAELLRNPHPPSDPERAFRMYHRAIAAYERCGLVDEARALGYELMCLKMRRARELHLSFWLRFELFVYWLTAGFGYRPFRVIGSAVAVVMLYALLYWAMNGVVAANSQERVGIGEAIYFSGITFATVGYGDFIPAPHVRLLALTEGAVGVFTIGFFVVVLANRLRR